MSLIPSAPDPNPYTELARLIVLCGGTPIHARPRHPRLYAGSTRLRFGIPKAKAGPIIAHCRKQGWRFTQPSGIQMVVDIPLSLADLQGPRQPALEEGQRELPS